MSTMDNSNNEIMERDITEVAKDGVLNKTIGAAVGGYKAIENGTVKGYKAIENAVVGTYTKIEDAFVDRFLKHEDESIGEAKERIRHQLNAEKEGTDSSLHAVAAITEQGDDKMTELQKAFSGKPFNSMDKEVIDFQSMVKDKWHEFNLLAPSDPRRNEIIASLVSGYNPYVFVESGFKCVFGKNIHFKGMAMINFDCTFLDSNIITIGDRTLIGPGCSFICTNHSIDPDERLQGVFNNKPITVGNRVWLGGNVTVLPGVTIGDGAVIGAGSVVTKDIPANVVAVGNPCRVLREVNEQDKLINR